MAVGSQTQIMPSEAASITDIWLAFGANMGQEHQHRPSCSKTTDPDFTMASGDFASHPHPCGSKWQHFNGQQHDFRLQHRPRTSIWPLVVAQATNVNIDLGPLRLWTQAWPSVTMHSGRIAGHSDPMAPSSSMASRTNMASGSNAEQGPLLAFRGDMEHGCHLRPRYGLQ